MATPPGSIIRPAASCSGPMRACRSTGAPARWWLQPDPLRCRQCLGIQRQLPSGAVWRRAMGPAGPAPGRGSHLACAARVASGGVRRVRGRAEVGLSRGHDPGLRRPGLSHRHGGGAVEPFVSAAYVNLRTGRIDERARGGCAQIPAATTLGLRASGRSRWAARPRPRARRGWRHALGDTTPASAQRFAGATRSRRPACRSRGMLR